MSEIKRVGLSVVIISVALGTSSCSMLSKLDVGAVNDNMKYLSNDASVRALSIPPGLSVPAFDNSYALNKPAEPVGSMPAAAVQQSSVAPVSTSTPPVRAQVQNSTPVQRSYAQALNDLAGVSRPGASTPAPQAQIQAPVQNTPAKKRTQVAMMRLKGGEPALAVNAPFVDTWKQLSDSLSNAGFKVTKQQPAEGIYTAMYQGSAAGLRKGETYLILVAENASKQSFIGVGDKNGKPVSEAVANQVIGLIKAEYER